MKTSSLKPSIYWPLSRHPDSPNSLQTATRLLAAFSPFSCDLSSWPTLLECCWRLASGLVPHALLTCLPHLSDNSSRWYAMDHVSPGLFISRPLKRFWPLCVSIIHNTFPFIYLPHPPHWLDRSTVEQRPCGGLEDNIFELCPCPLRGQSQWWSASAARSLGRPGEN